MLKDLKAFLFRGNVLDLAVAVIIGAAFKAIIDSLVADVITPLLLNPALKAVDAENISQLKWNGVAYGNFLSAIINFLIIGTVLFFIVKAAEKAMPKKVEEEVVAGPTQEELLIQIRDLLANK
ncbi:large conductance mechanosensitive channel protein MscL [Streptococcus sp. X16XC17]|uniref:large conductance mechanosensitive channel protein MscL n=1 Tax=unclassified Streptococcus TaxID=2608887 RepID=UPI00066FDAA6|nr:MULTISPECIES: large conductance mechanosensitive channel protein MscL [unclassified Streptococcus]TCD46466.1 large conductance mechanosensitive channel protein MscL [Streptococcus sp. X16XC17]